MTGDLAERVSPQDVQDLCKIAANASGRTDAPFLIKSFAQRFVDGPATLSNAVVCYPPFERAAGCWRGNYVECNFTAVYEAPDEPSDWFEAGLWRAWKDQHSREYLILPPRHVSLPVWPPKTGEDLQCVELRSKLESATLVEIIDTVRGFTKIMPDGSELVFDDLPLKQLRATAAMAEVDVMAPPTKEILAPHPIRVLVLPTDRKNWRVKRASENFCDYF